MRKKEVLLHLPERKELVRQARRNSITALKLQTLASRQQKMVEALEGVELHDNFPIKVMRHINGIEIRSGCDEVTRSAYIQPSSTSNKYQVSTYKGDGSDTDGTPIEGEYKKREALQLAKDYVGTGKKLRVEISRERKTSR